MLILFNRLVDAHSFAKHLNKLNVSAGVVSGKALRPQIVKSASLVYGKI